MPEASAKLHEPNTIFEKKIFNFQAYGFVTVRVVDPPDPIHIGVERPQGETGDTCWRLVGRIDTAAGAVGRRAVLSSSLLPPEDAWDAAPADDDGRDEVSPGSLAGGENSALSGRPARAASVSSNNLEVNETITASLDDPSERTCVRHPPSGGQLPGVGWVQHAGAAQRRNGPLQLTQQGLAGRVIPCAKDATPRFVPSRNPPEGEGPFAPSPSPRVAAPKA